MCANSMIGFFAPLPRRRATRLPLRGAGVKTCTSAAGNPALRSRAAIASAALAVSPVAVTVLISTSSLWMSRARRWCGESDCALARSGPANTNAAMAAVMRSLIRQKLEGRKFSIFGDGAQRPACNGKHCKLSIGLGRCPVARAQLGERHSLVDAAVGGNRSGDERCAPAAQTGRREREHADV